MPQLSEVAQLGPSLVNPYAATPDSIESRAWMLWRAAIGTAQRTGTPIGAEPRFDADGLVFQISLRRVAKDLFAGVPRDLAAVYAYLKDSQNAVCADRGGREVTPLWWFRAKFNTGDPVAEVTQLPIEAPAAPEPAKRRARSRRKQVRMSPADQRAGILKVLAKAEYPLYAEEIAERLKRHPATIRPHLLELLNDERAFRRHETLEERNGTPGRRHHLYWATAVIPLRPVELFKPSTRKSGNREGYVPPAVKSVLRRVEELVPGGLVSTRTATRADWLGIQELIDGGVVEFVDPGTRIEVRLASTAPETLNEYVERQWPEVTKSYVETLNDGKDQTVVDLGVKNLGANLEVGLKSLIEAEVARRLETRVATEVAELERRLTEAEAMRVTAQTELSVLKGRVQNLLG